MTLERAASLGEDALAQIFARYGRPLQIDAPLDAALALTTMQLGTLSYRSPVDVIANDWYVLVQGDERLAIAAPLFAAIVERLTARRS